MSDGGSVERYPYGMGGAFMWRWLKRRGYCEWCGGPHHSHVLGRLAWAAKTARHAKPRTLVARLRLLWHDFVLHGLLDRGTERCQDCGRDYDWWRADDGEWEGVMGGPSGLLCAHCFATARAQSPRSVERS